MGIETSSSESREKPAVLYHASSNKNIDVFEPRKEKVRDPKEGPRIFATPDKRLATIFLVPTDDRWATSGLFGTTPYLVVSDEKRFREMDMGGAIYSLPSDSFVSDPDKGLRELEWTSASSVRPIGKEEYDSALEVMLRSGVQVYFVDRQTFELIQKSEDHGYSTLKGLTSENTRQGVNPIIL